MLLMMEEREAGDEERRREVIQGEGSGVKHSQETLVRRRKTVFALIW